MCKCSIYVENIEKKSDIFQPCTWHNWRWLRHAYATTHVAAIINNRNTHLRRSERWRGSRMWRICGCCWPVPLTTGRTTVQGLHPTQGHHVHGTRRHRQRRLARCERQPAVIRRIPTCMPRCLLWSFTRTFSMFSGARHRNLALFTSCSRRWSSPQYFASVITNTAHQMLARSKKYSTS